MRRSSRDFVATQRPDVWTPPAPEMRVLQALVRRLDALLEMRTQEVNRLAAGVVVSEVRASIEAVAGESRRTDCACAAADSRSHRPATRTYGSNAPC